MGEFLLGASPASLPAAFGGLPVWAFTEIESSRTFLKTALRQPVESSFTDDLSECQRKRLAIAGTMSLALDTRGAAVVMSGGALVREIKPWSDEPLPPVMPGVAPSVPKGFLAADLVRPLLLDRPFDEGLYPYQRSGVAWLLRKRRALLADDMGLGKTLQVLAAIRRLVRIGHVRQAIIVAPGTLIETWVREAGKWAPELTCLAFRPRAADRLAGWKSLLGRSHLLVTSYEQLRAFPPELAGRRVELLVLDEAHRVRNVEAQVSQGVRLLDADRMWALTGTPVERDAEDLVALLALLEPTRFSPDDARMAPSQLRARVRPFVLRREKADVLSQLPPVVRREEELDLTPVQATAYRQAIRDYIDDPEATSFLALFNRLRSICDVDERSGESAKIDRIIDVVHDIRDRGEKVVVFSHLIRPLDILAGRLRAQTGVDPLLLTGASTLAERAGIVDRFKNGPEPGILLASSRVASEGLTLTEANHVVFLNRWWNPSQNRQAEDRVVRIGQERTVQVWTFVCAGTVETALQRILQEKQITFDELVQELSTTAGDPRATLSTLLGGDSPHNPITR